MHVVPFRHQDMTYDPFPNECKAIIHLVSFMTKKTLGSRKQSLVVRKTYIIYFYPMIIFKILIKFLM